MKYKVKVRRNVVMECELTIDADSEHQARVLAHEDCYEDFGLFSMEEYGDDNQAIVSVEKARKLIYEVDISFYVKSYNPRGAATRAELTEGVEQLLRDMSSGFKPIEQRVRYTQ